MSNDVKSVLFIGAGLRNLADPKAYTFDVHYLQETDQLFDFFEAGQVSLQTTVVFLHAKSMKSLETFIRKAEKELPRLLLVTPIIVSFTGKVTNKLDSVIKKFDLTVFHIPEKDSLENIVRCAFLKKNDKREQMNLLLINQEIKTDLLRKLKGKTGKIWEKGEDFTDLYYGVDEYGIVNTIGDEVLQVLGFSRDEIIGRHFSELIVRNEFERVKRAFTERRTGARGVKEVLIRFKTKDGGYKEFVIDAQGVHIPSMKECPRNNPGRVYIGTFGEVRIRGRREESMDVFDSSPGPMVIYSQIDKRMVVNRGFEQFSGYKKEELFDKNPGYFERTDKSFFNQYMDRIQTEKHCVYNTIFVSKQGDENYCEVSLDLVELDGKSYIIAFYNHMTNMMQVFDEVETLIKLSWDIGNTETVEGLIEASADKVASVLKAAFFTIAVLGNGKKIVDRYYIKSINENGWFAPGETLIHEYINPVIEEVATEKQTVYRDMDEIFEPSCIDHIMGKSGEGIAVISPLIVNKRTIGCIIALHKKDSSFTLQGIRLLELSSNVIAAGVRKLRLEKELRTSLENLEVRVKERTKELEDFVYTVSHDLKSPLHAAKSFAEMVKEQFGQYIKSSEDDYILRRIVGNIDQSISMIDDLLLLSRIGTQKLKIEEVDLNDIIQDYAEQFNALKNEKIRLEIDIREKLPMLQVDRGRIIQLFTNIFNNSIKYKRGKDVKIIINSEGLNGRIRLSIEDNGIGIDEKDLPNVFNIFYRAIAGDKPRSPEGSGVGLTIVKKIIEQHGGSIDIKSKANAGTTVILELPHYHK